MTPEPNWDPLAAALVTASAALYGRGWMEGTAGNLSIRPPGQTSVALITASGRSKGELTTADIVAVDVSTNQPLRAGGPRPSAETQIHTALYRAAPACGAVIHAHAPYATAVAAKAAAAGSAAVRFRDFELIKGFGLRDPGEVTVPVFPNWPHVARIAADIAAHCAAPPPDPPPVLLIAHHGATAWGPTLEAARNRLECLEGICRLHLLTQA